MSVHISFKQGDKESKRFMYVCFGVLNDRRSVLEKNPGWIFEHGVSIQYHFIPENLVLFKKYVSYLNETNMLEYIQITYKETEVTASCSTEIPGQEIVGKFELLRSGVKAKYCSAFIYMYDLCKKELIRISEQARNYAIWQSSFYQKRAIVHTLNILSLFRVVLTPNTILEAFCYFPSLNSFELSGSRQITKPWRESCTFYGVHTYFIGSAREQVLQKIEVRKLVVQEEDKRYFWLISELGTELPEKEFNTIFNMYLKYCFSKT